MGIYYIYTKDNDCKVIEHDVNNDAVKTHKDLLTMGWKHVNTINGQIVLERILNAGNKAEYIIQNLFF